MKFKDFKIKDMKEAKCGDLILYFEEYDQSHYKIPAEAEVGDIGIFVSTDIGAQSFQAIWQMGQAKDFFNYNLVFRGFRVWDISNEV